MEFEFKLPSDWTYAEDKEDDSFHFWKRDDPTHTFSLTKTALAVYGDDPVQLVKIISMQMEMLEASAAARTATSRSVPPATQVCTTPHYCAWARKYGNGINKPCYCEKPEYKQLRDDRRDRRQLGDYY